MLSFALNTTLLPRVSHVPNLYGWGERSRCDSTSASRGTSLCRTVARSSGRSDSRSTRPVIRPAYPSASERQGKHVTSNRHGDNHQQSTRPQAMPEQEGQSKGKDNRTVVARERVICRMVQEVITDVVNERTIVGKRCPISQEIVRPTTNAMAILMTNWRWSVT